MFYCFLNFGLKISRAKKIHKKKGKILPTEVYAYRLFTYYSEKEIKTARKIIES